MVAGAAPRCNLALACAYWMTRATRATAGGGAAPAISPAPCPRSGSTDDTTSRTVAAASTLLALRLAGQDHALEPGRDYLLGSATDCDLRFVVGAAAHQARLCVRGDGVTLHDLAGNGDSLHNGAPVTTVELATGDVLQFGDHLALVVPDDGAAAIVPIPALRAAAGQRKVRDAAAALRRDDEQTLSDLLATELRRAPWLALSLLFHVLLLLLLWWYLPAEPAGGRRAARVGLDLAAAGTEVPDERPAPPEVLAEADEAMPLVADPVPAEAATTPGPDQQLEPRPLPTANFVVRAAPRAGSADPGDGGGLGIGSGEFRRAVGTLRQSGLEIVFVFDSTGSMSRTIADTKTTIGQMLTVLRHLVPDARFGLVTYRDRGREQYLTRDVPLGFDFWRVANFVQYVSAEGGGDLPEAVREGLQTAFAQRWQPDARRVVVLAGDAPPHAEDMKVLLQQVGAFAQDGRSFVHTLITAAEPAPPETQQTFREIANAGRGLCERLDARDRVLQRVLTFAFGREFDQDIRAVIAAVDREQQRVDVRALDVVRRAGAPLREALLQNPVPQTVWNALLRRPNRAAAALLLDLLTAPKTPEPSRQAAAAALQRVLDLTLPPLDPFGERDLAPPTVTRLRRLIERLPQ